MPSKFFILFSANSYQLTFLMGFKLRSKKGEIGERFAQGNGPLKGVIERGTKNDAYRTQLITKEPS